MNDDIRAEIEKTVREQMGDEALDKPTPQGDRPPLDLPDIFFEPDKKEKPLLSIDDLLNLSIMDEDEMEDDSMDVDPVIVDDLDDDPQTEDLPDAAPVEAEEIDINIFGSDFPDEALQEETAPVDPEHTVIKRLGSSDSDEDYPDVDLSEFEPLEARPLAEEPAEVKPKPRVTNPFNTVNLDNDFRSMRIPEPDQYEQGHTAPPSPPAEEQQPVRYEFISKNSYGAWVFLLLGVVLYCAIVGNMISRAFVDIGDGNYLYTASRMADGLTIYKDFLSPQPPMHMLAGEALIHLGREFDNPDAPVYTVRIFSLILHVLTMIWIVLLARRFGRSAWTGAIAGVIYLFAPISFWWSLGYQSELQELFWMFGALYLYIRFTPRSMILAGAMTGLSVLTNMTAAPYAVAALFYLIVRHGTSLGEPNRRYGWSLIFAFLVPLVAVVGGVSAYYETTTGAFFKNVIFNQVGSYPTESFGAFFEYAKGKVLGQGQKILVYDGGLFILGLLGLLRYNRSERRAVEREYVVWYSLALLLSFLYVTKGGTMDYIFCIGEPVLALFGAYFLTHTLVLQKFDRFFRKSLWHDTSFFPQIALIFLLAVVVLAFPIRFWLQVGRGEQFEQTEEQLDRVLYYIEEETKPGDTIIAPPYYAFISKRLLAREYSELFLWRMKYDNEKRAYLVNREELSDPSAFIMKMMEARDAVSLHLQQYLMPETRLALDEMKDGDLISTEMQDQLARSLSEVVGSEDLLSQGRFDGIELSESISKLAASNPIGADLWRMNRLLLEAAYPGIIAKNKAAQEPDGEGITEVKALAEMVRNRSIPLLIADFTQFSLILHSEEIREAVEEHYKPLISEKDVPFFRTSNFQMQLYVPKDDAAKR